MENIKNDNKGRVMIILWSWKKNEMKDDSEIWSVGDEKESDKVICIDLKNSTKTKEFIYKQVDDFYKKHIVYIFLHRKHHFIPKDITEMLSYFKNTYNIDATKDRSIKCFLFGDERDYIYVSTQQEGLLGKDGVFGGYLEIDSEDGKTKKNKVNVVRDATKKLLEIRPFNKVWNYYSFEFKKKLFELKEEAICSFIDLVVKKDFLSVEDHYNCLRKNDLILLRLKSLTNLLSPDSKDEKQLKTYEKEHQKSFIFDDCNRNLLQIYGKTTKKKYKELVDFISQQFLNEDPVYIAPLSENLKNDDIEDDDDLEFPAMPSYLRWIQFRNKFETLLSTMPEATFY